MERGVGVKRKAPVSTKVAGALDDLDAAVQEEERARAAAAAAAAAAEAAAAAASQAPFIPAAAFQGAIPGYFFQAGEEGIGCAPRRRGGGRGERGEWGLRT